jgi:hypothetical protein
LEECPLQNRIREIGAIKYRVTSVRIVKIGILEICLGKICISQIGIFQEGLAKVYGAQIGAAEREGTEIGFDLWVFFSPRIPELNPLQNNFIMIIV